MVGYAEGQKAYRLWVPAQRKMIVAESVYFDEDSTLHDHTDNSLPLLDLLENKTTEQEIPHPDPTSIGDLNMDIDMEPSRSESPLPSSPIIPPIHQSQPSPPSTLQNHPQCVWKEPARLQFNSSEEAFQKAAELPPTHKDSSYYVNLANKILREEHTHFAYSAITLNTDAEPKSYKEAMRSPQSEEWQEAIDDEKNSLVALGVFETMKCSDVLLP